MKSKPRKLALLIIASLCLITVITTTIYWESIVTWYVLQRDFKALKTNEQGLPEYEHKLTGIIFVKVPGGSFKMGSPGIETGRLNHEGPQKSVKLSSFLIAKYEVSQKQWEKITGKRQHKFVGETFPRGYLLWEDCKNFCDKTSLSLPTEAQWEYACRSGSDTLYSNGSTKEELKKIAWFRENSRGGPNPIGMKGPNQFGLHDMHGNALEWCADKYVTDYYRRLEDGELNPKATAKHDIHAMRGGAWLFGAENLRSAWRYSGFKLKTQTRAYFGFRPVWNF